MTDFIRRGDRGQIVGVAIAPPSSELELWTPATEADREEIARFEADPIAYSQEFQPNWAQFRNSMVMHGGYLRLVSEHRINGVLNAQLIPLLWQATGAPELLMDAMNLWNAIAANVPPTEAEVTAFRSICQVCNMPFTVADNGYFMPI